MILLNILPPKKRIEYELVQSARFLVGFFEVLLAITGAVALILVIARTSLRNRVEQIVQPPRAADAIVTTLEGQVQSFNTLVRTIDTVSERSFPWSLIVEDLVTRVPNTIHLSALAMEQDKKLTIRGIAATRNDLLEFKNRLEQSPWVGALEFPNTNLLTPVSVPFEIRATVRPEFTPQKAL
ncbi:PilN domain-containing protein [Candidatus Uhrbacteria bacterium]|nr:PilN domain-containing protein [Candidatus Uhrbacteria bacterium]